MVYRWGNLKEAKSRAWQYLSPRMKHPMAETHLKNKSLYAFLSPPRYDCSCVPMKFQPIAFWEACRKIKPLTPLPVERRAGWYQHRLICRLWPSGRLSAALRLYHGADACWHLLPTVLSMRLLLVAELALWLGQRTRTACQAHA